MMKRFRFLLFVILTIVALAPNSRLYATFIYTETFPTDVSSFPGSDPNYSEWTMLFPTASSPFIDPTNPSTYSLTPSLAATSANVTSGQLRFVNTVRVTSTHAAIEIPNSSHVVLTADVGALSGATGFTGPGLFIGNLGFRFTPGFSGGALFVGNLTTSAGFDPALRINLGYTPGFGTISQFSVDLRKTGATTADADVQIATGSNSFSQTFSLTDVGGLDTAGFFIVNDGQPVFDNLSITAEPIASAVPEPASITLLFCGLLGVFCISRVRHRTPTVI